VGFCRYFFYVDILEKLSKRTLEQEEQCRITGWHGTKNGKFDLVYRYPPLASSEFIKNERALPNCLPNYNRRRVTFCNMNCSFRLERTVRREFLIINRPSKLILR